MNFEIRKMRLEDVPAVAELDRISFTLPWPERSFRFEVSENTASRCYVADADKRIIGAVVSWLLVDELHIATLATHPDFRRQGIAQSLLIHVLRLAGQEGAVSSFLEVRAGNLAAQAMYQKFGYQQVGLRRRYYKDNDEDAILMLLEDLSIKRLESLKSSNA